MGFKTIDSIVGHFGLIYDLSPPLMAFIPSLTLLALALLAINRIQE
jgi:lipopolysaccharide export system permease protein